MITSGMGERGYIGQCTIKSTNAETGKILISSSQSESERSGTLKDVRNNFWLTMGTQTPVYCTLYCTCAVYSRASCEGHQYFDIKTV